MKRFFFITKVKKKKKNQVMNMHELRDEAISYNFPSCYSIQSSYKIFLKAWEPFKTFPHFVPHSLLSICPRKFIYFDT